MPKSFGAKNQKSILFLLFFGYLVATMDRFIMNYAIIPISDHLQLSASESGFVLSAFFAGYAIMQMPGGWLADKMGPRFVLMLSLVAWSIFTGLTGVAWGLGIMLVIRFLFGLGEGGFIPASGKMIALTYPTEKRSRALSGLFSAAAVAGIITPIIATSLMVTIGWQMIFYLSAILGIITAVIYWFFLKPKYYEDHAATIQTSAKSLPDKTIQKGSVIALCKTPMIWALMIASFSMYFQNWGIASWLPTYLVKERGLDLSTLGMLQIIPGITSVLFLFLAGYIIDKLPAGKEKWLGAICGLGLTLFVYLMFNAPNTTMFIIYQSLSPLFATTITVLCNAIPLKKLADSVSGTAIGMISFGGQLAGFIAPLSIGYAVDLAGGSFSAAIWLIVGFCFLGFIAFSLLNDKKGALLQANNKSAHESIA